MYIVIIVEEMPFVQLFIYKILGYHNRIDFFDYINLYQLLRRMRCTFEWKKGI